MRTLSPNVPAAVLAGPPPTPATPGLLRSINDRVVLDLLLEHKTLSRSDVRRLTGVSKPTASQLLTRLEESGHVLESGLKESGRGGRASRIYELNPTIGHAAAIAVRASGLHIQVADVRGDVVSECLVPQEPSDSSPRAAIAALTTLLAATGLVIGDLTSIVIAVPGSFDATADRLRYAGSLKGWQNIGVVATLKELTDVAVSIENDVNLVAAAEHRLGAVRSVDDFFLFWADDGIGGALMIGGRLYRGSTGGAGEIAFLQLPGASTVNQPNQDALGGFDHLVGNAEILLLARQLGAPGETADSIMAIASQSPEGLALLRELARRYAVGLASIVAVFDPAVIVLAGTLMAAGGTILRDLLGEQLSEVAIRVPRLALSTIEGDPVIAGALLVSLDHTRDSVLAT
jgi:predicted NBD/HSP70 family sugar kinase